MSDGRYPCVVETTTSVNARKTPGGEYLDTFEPGYILAIEQQEIYAGAIDSFQGIWYKFYDGWVIRDFVIPILGKDCSKL